MRPHVNLFVRELCALVCAFVQFCKGQWSQDQPSTNSNMRGCVSVHTYGMSDSVVACEHLLSYGSKQMFVHVSVAVNPDQREMSKL